MYFGPGELALFRFLTASLVLIPFLIIRKSRLPANTDIIPFLLTGFIGIGIYHYCLNAGERSITAGTAGFLSATTPVFTAIFGFFFLKEQSSFKTWIGLFVSLLGIAIISFGESGFGKIKYGTLLVLASAASGAVYVIYQKKLLIKYSPLEVTAYSIIAGTFILMFYFPTMFKQSISAPLSANIEALYLGIFPAAIAYLIWTVLLPQFQSATHTTTYLYFIPVFSSVFAYLILREIPQPTQILGGLLTMAGVVLSNYRKKEY